MPQVDLTGVAAQEPPRAAVETLVTTRAAEVLVVGPDDWALADATAQLVGAGRTVHRCSESAEAPFPCNALLPEIGCPLQRHQVDVVLHIRSRADSQPSLAEMGAICAIRDGIPIVTAGMSELPEFAPWAERVPYAGDIVATCDEVVQERG